MTGPLILDTDLGGDPHDAVALVLAAASPRLRLVITCDEVDGHRARLARHLLDLLDRRDVPVAAGPDIDPPTAPWCMSGTIPGDITAQPHDVRQAVAAVLRDSVDPVTWVGLGPLTNLAALPDPWRNHLTVVQMGGSFDYRGDQAEHNLSRDVAAAAYAVTRGHPMHLVTSDVTFNRAIELTPGHPLHHTWTRPDAPLWARLLVDHLDRWITTAAARGSVQLDPLTVSAAFGLPFVGFGDGKIRIDHRGRIAADATGTPIRHSLSADFRPFMAWLAGTLRVV